MHLMGIGALTPRSTPGCCASILKPRRVVGSSIAGALANPIGSRPFHELAKPGDSVAILVSDATRACPTDLMLSPLVEQLGRAGVGQEDVKIVFGLGTHRRHTAGEQARLVGERIFVGLQCLDTDPSQVTHVGTTSRGTPIEVFEPVTDARLRIALGAVEFHYFAGYTDGGKALVPGVCSANTISHNHAMMVQSGSRPGVLEGNPVREDIEEGAGLIGVDFLLNVVLDGSRNVVGATAGDVVEAHRVACSLVDGIGKIALEGPSDIVLVGAGGYPKDINLYQAQKSLSLAATAVRRGGVIIWVAECVEGFGNVTFQDWLLGGTPSETLERIERTFVLGGHKAAAVARVVEHASVWLVSALPEEMVRGCGLTPYSSIGSALHDAIEIMGVGASVVVIPDGTSVLPSIGQGASARDGGSASETRH